MKRRAFSLIELLVVIAIIAVLAAILFPVFSRAKEASKRVACVSNARQLGMSVMIYVEDHNGAFPMAANYDVPTTDRYRIWTAQVFNYIENRGIFNCPSADGKFGDTWATRGEMTIGFNGITAFESAGCDENQEDTFGCEGFTTPARVSRMVEPSRSALFADTPGGPISQKYRGFVFSPHNGIEHPTNKELSLPLIADRDLVRELNHLPPRQLKPVFARHQKTGKNQGFTSVIFADGHAKAYSANSILAMDEGANIIWRFR